MEKQEERLLRRAKRGDERAFEELVRLYEGAVFSYAVSMLGSRQDAEEVTQDVFVKLWRTTAQFRGACSVSTWIMRIARNAVTDRLRTRREETLPLYTENGAGEEYELPLIDEDPDHNPPQAHERAEKIATVRRAIAALPEDHREVIILRDLGGYSYAEIAEMLSLEDGTVRSRLNRARQNLKKILESWNFSP